MPATADEGPVGRGKHRDESQLASVGRVCLDVAAVAISLADVVSDIVVAVEFGLSEEWLWFGLVMGSLCVSCMLYVVIVILNRNFFFGDRLRAWLQHKNVPFGVQLAVVILISPLLPLAHWIRVKVDAVLDDRDRAKPDSVVVTEEDRTKIVMRQYEYSFDSIKPELVDDEQHVPAAARSIFKAALDTPIRHLSEGMGGHVAEHILFFLETACESLPQAVVQLLALHVLGSFSTAQAVSVVLSILCIGSKAYVICVSSYVSVYVAKMGLCVFDLFTVYYVFSALLEESSAGEGGVGISGSFRPSPMALAWYIQLLIVALCLGGFSLFLFIRNIAKPRSVFEALSMLGAFVLGVLAFPLLLIAAEAVKLSWVIYLVYRCCEAVGIHTFASWRMLTEFLMQAPNDAAYHRRAAAVLRCCVRQARLQRSTYAHREEAQEAMEEFNAAVEKRAAYGDEDIVSSVNLFHLWKRAVWDSRWLTTFDEAHNHRAFEHRVLTIVFTVYAVVSVPTNIAFVIVHASSHFGTINGVQHACLWGAVAALLTTLLMLPLVDPVLRAGAVVSACTSGMFNACVRTNVAARMINAYFTPPPAPMLAAECRSSLPEALTISAVAPFLDRCAVHPLEPITRTLLPDLVSATFSPSTLRNPTAACYPPPDAHRDAAILSRRAPTASVEWWMGEVYSAATAGRYDLELGPSMPHAHAPHGDGNAATSPLHSEATGPHHDHRRRRWPPRSAPRTVIFGLQRGGGGERRSDTFPDPFLINPRRGDDHLLTSQPDQDEGAAADAGGGGDRRIRQGLTASVDFAARLANPTLNGRSGVSRRGGAAGRHSWWDGQHDSGPTAAAAAASSGGAADEQGDIELRRHRRTRSPAASATSPSSHDDPVHTGGDDDAGVDDGAAAASPPPPPPVSVALQPWARSDPVMLFAALTSGATVELSQRHHGFTLNRAPGDEEWLPSPAEVQATVWSTRRFCTAVMALLPPRASERLPRLLDADGLHDSSSSSGDDGLAGDGSEEGHRTPDEPVPDTG